MPEAFDAADLARARARSFRRAFEGASLGAYRGIPVFAAPGLHELVAARLAAALVPADGARVLELGAGAGAMSQRLDDLGYVVTASDLFVEGFTPRDRIPFVPLDLNGHFADLLEDRFDAVVALELVEHLENPHHFLRQCFQLLKPGGAMVLSTPNLGNPVSQALFVRSGMFQWFADADYRDQGHIMPIAPVVLRRCWQEAGFEVRWEGSVSDPWRRVRKPRMLGTLVLACLLALVSGAPRGQRGEVYVAVLRRPADPAA